MKITVDDLLSDFHGVHSVESPASPRHVSSPVPHGQGMPSVSSLFIVQAADDKAAACGGFEFGGGACAAGGEIPAGLAKAIIGRNESSEVERTTPFGFTRPIAAILSYSAILGAILALFCLTACGQPIPMPPGPVDWSKTIRFTWKANPEPDLDGYLLNWRIPKTGFDWTFGIPREATNYALTVQRTNGNYFTLRAINAARAVSDPTPELVYPPPLPPLGTNTAVIVFGFLPDGQWLCLSSNRIEPTNDFQILRAAILKVE